MFRRLSVMLLALATVVALSWAAKFWEKPYPQWKHSEVLKMLNDSPWAEKYIRTRQIAGRNTTGIGGDRELYDVFTVRFFSALPVRHAYVRMFQLLNNYEEMSNEEKRAFDERFSAAIEMDVSDQIIVAFEFESNDGQLSLQINQNLRTTTADLQKQNAFLISDRLGRVELKEYYPPAPDGTGAKFVFPRQVKGQPVVSPKDKEIKFEFYHPDYGKVLIRKKVRNMMYGGELEI